MKHPGTLRRWLLLFGLLFLLAEYVTLTWIAPHFVLRSLQRIMGGDFHVGRARLLLPLTSELHDVVYAPSTAQSTLRAEQVLIEPRWIPSTRGEVDIRLVRIEHPYLRLSRQPNRTIAWPRPALAAAVVAAPEPTRNVHVMGWQLQGIFHVRIENVQIVDGTLEWIDESTPTPVHLVLEHVSFDLGPLTVPSTGESASLAMRAAINSPTGEPSPLYCSGWWAMASRSMDVSCHFDPTPLSLVEPYFQGRPVIRFYSSTLETATRWNASGNQLVGRVQLDLGNLTHGDISVHGHTIMNARQLAGDEIDPKLTGDLVVTGPFDDRGKWQTQFLPTNIAARRFVERLFELKVKALWVPLIGGHGFRVQLARSAAEPPTDVEAFTKEISEALELLASPPAEPEPVAAPAPEAAPAPAAVAPEAGAR